MELSERRKHVKAPRKTDKKGFLVRQRRKTGKRWPNQRGKSGEKGRKKQIETKRYFYTYEIFFGWFLSMTTAPAVGFFCVPSFYHVCNDLYTYTYISTCTYIHIIYLYTHFWILYTLYAVVGGCARNPRTNVCVFYPFPSFPFSFLSCFFLSLRRPLASYRMVPELIFFSPAFLSSFFFFFIKCPTHAVSLFFELF